MKFAIFCELINFEKVHLPTWSAWTVLTFCFARVHKLHEISLKIMYYTTTTVGESIHLA